ncbi:hypothetical protein NE237_021487 [Protea cynaroides]|uniref:DUF4283 domain-containing protein n=1 Tax=Protea cynaroides TaxID=273540 RepID=A0A9Q0K3K5_9MAGN|nr:hypothetical protein NE237_021487 [Protea cynaroides]
MESGSSSVPRSEGLPDKGMSQGGDEGISISTVYAPLSETELKDELVIPEEEDPSLNFSPDLTLVGKVLSSKPVQRQAVFDGLTAAWNTTYGVHSRVFKDDLYTFTFSHDMDLLNVLDEAPWTAGGHLIMLE